ncbi:MAG: CDP-alcohol phosphatidyltransferase family protein [Dehalococcoidia bacterium]|nr:CDP-alcohol phosphatidyltransferase family protein [Dehalococcoidia bacterium]
MSLNLNYMRRTLGQRITVPVIAFISKSGVTPNTLTIIGFLITLAAAALVGTGHLFVGGIVILIAGLFDMLDGALARARKQESFWGSFLDSTLDRLSEAALLLGLLTFCLQQGLTLETVLTYIVFAGSMMVSYVRSKAESLGLKCTVGWFTRPERVIVLALGLLFNQILILLGILLVFTWITVIQRIAHVRQQARNKSS